MIWRVVDTEPEGRKAWDSEKHTEEILTAIGEGSPLEEREDKGDSLDVGNIKEVLEEVERKLEEDKERTENTTSAREEIGAWTDA